MDGVGGNNLQLLVQVFTITKKSLDATGYEFVIQFRKVGGTKKCCQAELSQGCCTEDMQIAWIIRVLAQLAVYKVSCDLNLAKERQASLVWFRPIAVRGESIDDMQQNKRSYKTLVTFSNPCIIVACRTNVARLCWFVIIQVIILHYPLFSVICKLTIPKLSFTINAIFEL